MFPVLQEEAEAIDEPECGISVVKRRYGCQQAIVRIGGILSPALRGTPAAQRAADDPGTGGSGEHTESQDEDQNRS